MRRTVAIGVAIAAAVTIGALLLIQLFLGRAANQAAPPSTAPPTGPTQAASNTVSTPSTPSTPAGPAGSPSGPSPASSTGPSELPSDLPSGGVPEEQPASMTEAARKRWEPVVTGFAKAFTDTRRDRTAWRTALIPYGETPVDKDLASYDRSTIPAQRYDSYEVVAADETDFAVQVDYAGGFAMVLYVRTTNDGKDWLVYAYDQLEQ